MVTVSELMNVASMDSNLANLQEQAGRVRTLLLEGEAINAYSEQQRRLTADIVGCLIEAIAEDRDRLRQFVFTNLPLPPEDERKLVWLAAMELRGKQGGHCG